MEPDYSVMEQLHSYSEEQRNIIFTDLAIFQITDGCTGGCSFCGKRTNDGGGYPETISKYVPFDQIVGVLEEKARVRGEKPLRINVISFYDGSDPFHWEDGGHNYLDVAEAHRELLGTYPTFSTRVSEGKEDMVIDAIERGHNAQLSIDSRNRGRLEASGHLKRIYELIDQRDGRGQSIRINTCEGRPCKAGKAFDDVNAVPHSYTSVDRVVIVPVKFDEEWTWRFCNVLSEPVTESNKLGYVAEPISPGVFRAVQIRGSAGMTEVPRKFTLKETRYGNHLINLTYVPGEDKPFRVERLNINGNQFQSNTLRKSEDLKDMRRMFSLMTRDTIEIPSDL